jgi:hypothetical protein
MKIFFLILIGLHGLIHIMGFIKAIKPEAIKELKQPVTKTAGIVWLVTCILILFSLGLFLFQNPGWWLIAIVSIILSQVLIYTSWKDAKFGTIFNVLFIGMIVLAFMDKL